MERRRKHKLTELAVVAGYALVIPSGLGLINGLMLLFSAAFRTLKLEDEPYRGFGELYGAMWIAFSLLFGVAGWLLIRKKQVLQCMQCRATVDAP